MTHAKYKHSVFKNNFIIGTLVLYLGLWVSNQSIASSINGLLCSLLGGLVIGICYLRMSKHAFVCTPRFYDYVVQLKPDKGCYAYWRIYLLVNLLLTLLCLVFALSMISLPICLQLVAHKVVWWYLVLLILIYRRIGIFVKIQCRGWKLIKEKALAFEQLSMNQ